MRALIFAIALALAFAAAPAARASQATLVTPGPALPMTGLAAFLNAAFLSIGSQNSGTAAPANGTGGLPFAGESWCNTTLATWSCALYDGTGWGTYGYVSTSSHGFLPNAASYLHANLGAP